MEENRWEYVRGPDEEEEVEMADPNDPLKGKLYPYLRERAKRRAMTQGGNANTELEGQFLRDREKSEQGAILSALSSMQSGMGTLGGKSAKSHIIQDYYKTSNDAAQQGYKNMQALRESEENSARTDLSIAGHLRNLDNDSKSRDIGAAKEAEGKRRWEAEQGLRDKDQKLRDYLGRKKAERTGDYKESDFEVGGAPLVFEPATGSYKAAPVPPGTKRSYRPIVGGAGPSYQVIPGQVGPNGGIITRDPKTGNMREEVPPEGSKSTKPSGSALTEKQVEKINAFDEGLETLQNILVQKPGIETGPMADIRNRAAKAIGIDDPKVTSFRADVQDRVAEYIHKISGAAASNSERKFLFENVPTMADSDATFLAKTDRLIKHLMANRERYVSGLAKIGKNTSEFETPSTPTDSEMVTIENPNTGTRRQVPKSKADGYLKKGGKIVQ